MTSRHGLANVGNTCYLNSAFQALGKSKPFVAYFGTDAWTQHRHAERKGHNLANHCAELVVALHEPGDKMINPSNFVRSFIEFAREINDEIRFGAQADAAEAIQILLDGLHTQQAREVSMDIKGVAVTADQVELIKSLESWSTFFRKEYSPLIDAFYGQTQTKIVCSTCKNCSTRYEPWAILKAPIPGAEKPGGAAPTLQECITSALATETLDDYACDGCKKKGSARMEHTISRFPRHPILSLVIQGGNRCCKSLSAEQGGWPRPNV
jgi:ubiquitin C-terminal hydrolase